MKLKNCIKHNLIFPLNKSNQTDKVIPLITFVWVLILIFFWIMIVNNSQNAIIDQIQSASKNINEEIPFFIETGQNLISRFSKNGVTPEQSDPSLLNLNDRIKEFPYFSQIFIISNKGDILTSYPDIGQNAKKITTEEISGLQLSLNGVNGQVYIILPEDGQNESQISFLSPIDNAGGNTETTIIGRTVLRSNPLFIPNLLNLFKDVENWEGIGYISDRTGNRLYQTRNDFENLEQGNSSENIKYTNIKGSRYLVIFSNIETIKWSIVIAIPLKTIIKQSFTIYFPIFGGTLILWGFVVVLWSRSIRRINTSINNLDCEVESINQSLNGGPNNIKYDQGIITTNPEFDSAREKILQSISELKTQLIIANEVASNIELSKSLEKLLNFEIQRGAISARVVLNNRELNNENILHPQVIVSGDDNIGLKYLDNQILDILLHQEKLIIPKTVRARQLVFNSENEKPGAILGFALRKEGTYYGAFWLAYQNIRNFENQEIERFEGIINFATIAVSRGMRFDLSENEKQRFENVINTIPEPVFVIDSKNCLVFINKAGIDLGEKILINEKGSPISKIITYSPLGELLTLPVDDKISIREIGLPNNRIYSASLSLIDDNNFALGKMCILRDITYYKQVDQLKSEFVSTVSHDLRSPLTLLSGNITMLQMVGELNSQQKGYIGKITNGIESMSKLVNNLLDLGKIEKGVGLRTEKVLGTRIVEGVINSLQPQATQKKVTLSTSNQSDQQLIIEADPALLQQALFNLVENAIKFSPSGSEVAIIITPQTSSAIFEVCDKGIGIAPLDLPHTFEKFYKNSGRELNQNKGTGLGLAIVKSIAEFHHGNVWVESQLGKGSKFFLEIPYKH